MKTRTFLYLSLLILSLQLQSQSLQKGYYLFPINPKSQNYLAGTFGEIRSAHFHTGIDVKTGNRVGLPIYATADGFIERVKVATGGYGNVLYMRHTNGTVSVYAHLQKFHPKIDSFVTETQYKREIFGVNLYPKSDQFPFKKGDIIGFSGNSGSSTGPHLHFEIRDKNHNPMDALSADFLEIKDTKAPIVKRIAFVTLDKNARINGYFGRYEFDLAKDHNNNFTNTSPIHLRGKVGVEIYSYDPMNDINNKNGIAETVLIIGKDTVFSERKYKLYFGKQRNALVHYNFPANKSGSRRFNRLYKVKGNEQNIYQHNNWGTYFSDENKKITITTKDSYDNLSKTKIHLATNIDSLYSPRIDNFSQTGQFLHLKAKESAIIFYNDTWQHLLPYTSTKDENFYLIDLKEKLPNQIKLDDEMTETNWLQTVYSNQEVLILQPDFEALFPKRALFDNIYLKFRKEIDTLNSEEHFRFLNYQTPLRKHVHITLKPEQKYDTEKASVYSVWNGRYGYQGGKWEDDKIKFKTRSFATYTIKEDTIPPTIKPHKISKSGCSFIIKDELSGIKSFRAELNGEFLLMEYEPKRKLIESKTRKPNIPLSGELWLEVVDNANNKTYYTKKL